MEYIFKTETIHDLSVHKEFSRGFLRASLSRNLLYLLVCLILMWYMTQFQNPILVYGFLFFAAFWVVLYLIRNPKSGDIQYKRMLQGHNGEPQHLIINMCEDGIHCIDRMNDNRYDMGYDLFRSIIETENLLILVMRHRSCLILQKRWLKGGTVEELISFLQAHCPNLKPRSPRKTTLGKWIHRLHAAILIIGTLLAIANLPSVSLWDKLTGKLHNDMTYQEMADELAPLGITISDQTLSEMEDFDADYAAEYGAEYYRDNYSASKVFDLLYWEGSGIYDEETWEWTPSTSGVYWFDMEVWAVDSIYTDFLTGVSAMDEALSFANISEDYSDVDMEKGTGTVTISFDYNSGHYELDAEYYYDWFDTDILYDVGRILAADDNEKDLWFAHDSGQGLLLYYGTEDQVAALERKTGITFYDTVNMLMGH